MKIRSLLGKIRRRLNNKRIICNYVREFSLYGADSPFAYRKGKDLERNILIQSHVVEKGLSHKKIKPLFGYKRVSIIYDSLREYSDKYHADDYVISAAISSLNTYNSINRVLNSDAESDVFEIPEMNNQIRDIPIGAEEVTREEFFEGAHKQFSDFCKCRHSLRMYDSYSKEIEFEELLKCIELAQICPNACNRQAVRVKVILDSKRISEIAQIQGGADGFGDHSGAILIITSDISLYTMAEHNLSMIDCGIFIMNLVYALYEKELGSCVLNGCLDKKKESNLRRIVPIPENEMVAAIIAVSNIPIEETVKVAKSKKRKAVDITQLI